MRTTIEVETRMTDNRLWERQRCATIDEARELAAAIGTVRGQKAWTNKVWVDGKLVATFRGGKEVTP